jgi:hypothetical protein
MPAALRAQGPTVVDPHVLRLAGLQPTYVVNGRAKPITDIAAANAARVEKARAKRRVVLATRTVLLAPPPAGTPMPEPAVPSGPPPPPPAPPVATPTPPAASKAPPSEAEAAGVGFNFISAFYRACRHQWSAKPHTCYADVTSGKPQATSAPNFVAPPPQFLGPDDPAATPPPLMSVTMPSQIHSAQTTLSAEVAALAELHPDATATDPPPVEIARALHLAEQQPSFAKASAIPPVTLDQAAVVHFSRDDFVSVAFHGSMSTPDFATDGSVAAYGSTVSSDLTFAMQVTVAGHPIAYTKEIAALQAYSRLPADGTLPSLVVRSSAFGSEFNKQIDYPAGSKTLHYSEARKQQVREDLCGGSQTIPLVPKVDIELRVACPALFGYSLIADAVPEEASVQIAPVVNVGFQLSADVSAAGGLLTVGAVSDANLLTTQARVGGYADLVHDPNPTGPDANPKDFLVTVRPYEFATVRAGDGSIYLVLKLGSLTTYLKIYQWNPLVATDIDDIGRFSAYRLTH